MTIADDARGFEHRTIETNGVKLHVVVGGSGPLIVLLHGWPECWVTWRHVMGPLKDAGFTVAVPDLRGFNESEKPALVSAYRLEHVAADIAGLIRALGFERAHLVAHDWGGAVAWFMAQNLDESVDKLVVVNMAHPAIIRQRLRGLEQLRASYYVFVFQVPWLAERLVSADDFRPVRNILKHQPKRPGAFDDEDVRFYVDALKKPGALTAGLNYYRAAFRQGLGGGGSPPKKRVIDRPTLVLWGMNDAALPPGNLDGLEKYVADLRVVRIPDCTHWVQHEAPDVVVREALAFLQ